jgi:hypothetical protein
MHATFLFLPGLFSAFVALFMATAAALSLREGEMRLRSWDTAACAGITTLAAASSAVCFTILIRGLS